MGGEVSGEGEDGGSSDGAGADWGTLVDFSVTDQSPPLCQSLTLLMNQSFHKQLAPLGPIQ